jgi:DUF971 family protein
MPWCATLRPTVRGHPIGEAGPLGTLPTMSGTQVIDIEVERTVEVRVTYDDGVTAVFPVEALRLACPCAGCRGRREQGRPAWAGDSISIVDAELHGNWGISLRWSDGHDTGIYAWSYLRSWWEADEI